MCSMKPKILTVYRLGRHSARRPASWKHPVCEVAETVFLSSPAFPSLSLHSGEHHPFPSSSLLRVKSTLVSGHLRPPTLPTASLACSVYRPSPSVFLSTTVHISFSDAPSYSREVILSHLGSSPSASMVSFQTPFDLP